MTVALVTGGYGFVGSHLRPLLHNLGWDVAVVGRHDVDAAPGERYLRLDLLDSEALAACLEDTRPDVVFHLAATTPQRDPDATLIHRDAVGATLALVGALQRRGRPVRVVLAGSSAQYGEVPVRENPVTEDTTCRPVTTYGIAKLEAERGALALAGDGLEVVAARAFNHVGPGEGPRLVTGSLAAQVAAIVDGTASRVRMRGGEQVRDYTDVRDIARGYVALAERGTGGRVYNLCSGRPTKVKELLDGLLEEAGLDPSVVEVDPSPPGGIAYQVGAPDRARDELGWTADIPLMTSLADVLAEARRDA